MLEVDAGRIVQVSSLAGKGVAANRTAYCAAQWGLQGFTLALQAELAETGVQVHVINPANVATGRWATTNDPQPPPVLDLMLKPQDVADGIVWTLSRPDHVRIGEFVVDNARNPWSTG